ncbi:hypothetical protein AC579_5748 [Pseudocercospora musae]|uniref:Uncharacterized protein n=1 Tax=Pseudocercospora musae TaxID=113226 RepID=A0A139IRN0_9PEZI|nr:hypothetical protein AC579_5748 [Pseudocercospora musae]
MASHGPAVLLTALALKWPRLLVLLGILGLSTTFTAYITTDRQKTFSQLPDADTLLTSLKAPVSPEPDVECIICKGLLTIWAATHYLALALLKHGLALIFKTRFVAETLVVYAIAMAFLDLANHAIDQHRDLGLHWWKGVSRGDHLDSFMAGASVLLAGLLSYCYLTWTGL